MLHQKTDEHLNPSVEVHHLVGKLSTAETLLTEVQRTVPTRPGSFLVMNVCNQGKNLCSPCIIVTNKLQATNFPLFRKTPKFNAVRIPYWRVFHRADFNK